MIFVVILLYYVLSISELLCFFLFYLVRFLIVYIKKVIVLKVNFEKVYF